MTYPNFEEAQGELLKFLNENPHMIPFQKQIEEQVLKVAGKDPLKRIQAISDLIVDNMSELQIELKLLNFKLLSLTKESKEVH